MPASAAECLERETDVLPREARESLLSSLGRLANPALRVEREGITFHSPEPGRVAIAVVVTNAGGERTLPWAAFLSAAPFGAFVPWRPLAVVPVPPLRAGETTALRLDATRPMVQPLGPPDRVPPRRLLVALGAGDDPAARWNNGGSWVDAAAQAIGRSRQSRSDATPQWPAGSLPADLLELLGRGSFQWAGNLNIFLGGKPVERHLARALRVYPGRVNFAVFFVGARGRDAYSFSLAGGGASWDAALYDMTDRSSCALDRGKERPVEEGRWLEVVGGRVLGLAVCPPKDCEAGSVEVHVRQRSTGESAVVEFSLDPLAAGPGCYAV